MIQLIDWRCKSGFNRPGLQLSVLLLAIIFHSSELQCRIFDSTYNIGASASFEYFDLFRQTAEKSRTMAFTRSFELRLTVSKGGDSLVLGFSGGDQYASYSYFPSGISASANNRLRNALLEWSSSFGPFDYSLEFIFPFSRAIFPLNYDSRISLSLFDEAFAPEFRFRRTPAFFSGGPCVKDFTFNLNENNLSSEWEARVTGRPARFLEGSVFFSRENIKIAGSSFGYSSPFYWKIQTFAGRVNIKMRNQLSFQLGWETSDHEGDGILQKEKLRFGDFARGELSIRKWSIGGGTNIFSLPFSAEYSYQKFRGYGIGYIESWPFTPLASTIFDNRLYYDISGSVVIQSIETIVTIQSGAWFIEPSAGLYSIIPDVFLKHWEPDFLIFGIKNLVNQSFSLRRGWLLRIGGKFVFPLLGLKATAEIEQFVPIYIQNYEETKSPAPPGPAPATPGIPTSTDGGRRIKFQIDLP